MSGVDYQADWRAAQEAGHHPDCDGFMFTHRVEIERVFHGEAHSTWRAVCEECGCLHPGTYGQEADCRHYQSHTREVPCDLRCLKWDEAA